MNNRKHPTLTEEYIREQVAIGQSLCQIARDAECPSSTLIKRARKYNIKSQAKPGPKSNREKRKCRYCNSPITGRNKRDNIFCNATCVKNSRYEAEINRWKQGLWNRKISRSVRTYMTESADYKCQKCGWGKVNPYSGRIVLEVHHIDGDKTNQAKDNLIVLCPNCHSLTKNYRTLNLV